MQAAYFIAILTALGGSLFWFYNLLVKTKEDEEAKRLALKEAKKAKREAKKAN